MRIKSEKGPKRPSARGRPSKEAELKRLVADLGIDPALLDPRRVLASIAADPAAPAGARVAAAKALLVTAGAMPAETPEDSEFDALSQRAIEILNRKRPN